MTAEELIAKAKQALEEHDNSLPLKHSKEEAKAWAKKYNRLSKELESLIASNPNRKVRVPDEEEEQDDE